MKLAVWNKTAMFVWCISVEHMMLKAVNDRTATIKDGDSSNVSKVNPVHP